MSSHASAFSGPLHLHRYLLCSLFVVFYLCFGLLRAADQLPSCKTDDYKFDFTECDSLGGRWRVSVPVVPSKCTGGMQNAPVRVNKCYTSCEGGQFFNMSSLLCQECAPGHYSLGGGSIIDSFNDSSGLLPNGFRISTESTKHTPELDKKCNGWFVDPVSKNLISSLPQTVSMNENDLSDFGSGCVSVVTYTVKVVKSGRLRFTYHYQIPDDVSSSLLFTFHYRLYANGESNVIEDDSTSNIRFPMPTIEQNFDTIEVHFDQPGLYVFSWKSVLIGNLRGLMSTSRSSAFSGRFGNFVGNNGDNKESNEANKFQNRISSGLIRIKRIVIEGVAYASECTPCEAGTFAANVAMRECEPCPSNTAFAETGASKCNSCDPTTEYSSRGSTRCRKRPICGANDFYAEPIGKCDSTTKQQKIQYKWIEPRICIDNNHVFPSQDGLVNCTESTNRDDGQCDLGMEMKVDGVSEFCQFCPNNYYRCEKSKTCLPCPPFTSPYYALSVFLWNNSLPAWSNAHISTNFSSVWSQEYFADNPQYLNAYFSRQCIRTDDTVGTDMENGDKRDQRSYYYKSDTDDSDDSYSKIDECDSRIAWQPFHDHIRTGASAILDSYLILSVSVTGFRSIVGGEISFVFETHCEQGDRCVLLFIETKNDESDLQLHELVGNAKDSTEFSRAGSKKKFLSPQSVNVIVKEWTQSSNGRLSYRYKIDRNISASYSWVFKRSTSFQSYAKIYSLLLTNSMIGAAIECKSCPYQSQLTPNQCVTCPEGKYLEISKDKEDTNVSTHLLSTTSSSYYHCKQCPPNYVLNTTVALPLGIQSCLACGPNLITKTKNPICYSNCSVQFGQDSYDLHELRQPLHYRGGNLFTAGGTQYMHLFKISLCDDPKQSSLSTCLNNITAVADESSGSSGVRSYICRSTIIPDGSQLYATQSVSLGDELIGISRDKTLQNISVHEDFLKPLPAPYKGDTDYHLFFFTKTATGACPNGRRMTITMRCSPEVEKSYPGKAVVSTPKSCPDGTCDGCNFHLLIETGTAAACRLCRPFSEDYETLVGECVDGVQQVHYINPKGCVIKKDHDLLSGNFINIQTRPCTVLLPRQVQIGIAIATSLGLLLLLLVFHFWNQNRSLEYKYSKLIESSADGKGDDLSLDNCCVEEQDEEEIDNEPTVVTSHQLMFADEFDRNRNIPKEMRSKQHNRIDKKNLNLGSSREMQQLFSKQDQSPSLHRAEPGHRVDDEGYETIHLTSANGPEKIV